MPAPAAACHTSGRCSAWSAQPGVRAGRHAVARATQAHQLERVRDTQCAGEAAAAVAAAATEAEANRLGRQLRRWVQDEGGMVHPALELSLATPHGSRGMVAREAIDLEAALSQPMIAVPERCLLTTAAAAKRLAPLLAAARRTQPWWSALPLPAPQPQQARQLPPPELLLALLLASERRRGPASFWFPYIAALPHEPPCGWALPAQQVHAELAALGDLALGWEPQARAAAAAVQQRAEAAAATYGEALGVTAGDIRWALGHVLSRSFGSGDELALLPVIDCCNHRQHADRPQGFTAPSGQPCAAVCSRHRGEERALPAGAELCTTYVAGASPLGMFLNFGFVPPEHRGLS